MQCRRAKLFSINHQPNLMFDEMRKVAVCEDVYGFETTLSRGYLPKFFTYFRLKIKSKQHQTRKFTSKGKETLRNGTERKKKTQQRKRRNVTRS